MVDLEARGGQSTASLIEATCKGPGIEDLMDRTCCRPVGFSTARTFRALGLTPNAVSLLGIMVGVTGGHLLAYPNLAATIAGVLLLVGARALDSADGQLARMTNNRSPLGRILDAFSGAAISATVYLSLCIRVLLEGGSASILPIALAAAASHLVQRALSDYYRNAYQFFVQGPHQSDLDRSSIIGQQYYALAWARHRARKFFTLFYWNYTRLQESLTGSLQPLFLIAQVRHGKDHSGSLRLEYGQKNRPMLMYYGILAQNARMIVLFASLLSGQIAVYFVFELTVLNAVLASMMVRQWGVNREMVSVARRHFGEEPVLPPATYPPVRIERPLKVPVTLQRRTDVQSDGDPCPSAP